MSSQTSQIHKPKKGNTSVIHRIPLQEKVEHIHSAEIEVLSKHGAFDGQKINHDEDAFVDTGIDNRWKKALEKFGQHSQSDLHRGGSEIRTQTYGSKKFLRVKVSSALLKCGYMAPEFEPGELVEEVDLSEPNSTTVKTPLTFGML